MSKERLKEVDDWLVSMKEISSLKTDEKEIEEVQKRIDLFEWMRGEIYRVYGGETFKGYAEINKQLEQQNKRYREAINIINERAMLYGVNEQVHEAIQESVKALESESHGS